MKKGESNWGESGASFSVLNIWHTSLECLYCEHIWTVVSTISSVTIYIIFLEAVTQ